MGSGTALSNLNYGSIINPPDLTPYNAWTKITGTNDIYNTNSGNVGIGIIPTSPFEIYRVGWKIKWGNINTNFGCNKAVCNGPFRLYSVPLSNIITTFHDITDYDTPTYNTIRVSISTTGVYILNDLQTDGNIGFGVAPSTTYKCNINGSVNATSYYNNNNLKDFNT